MISATIWKMLAFPADIWQMTNDLNWLLQISCISKFNLSKTGKTSFRLPSDVFLILRDIFTIFSMVSAVDQNRCDPCDFSAFGKGPWCVTAELIEMAQYMTNIWTSRLFQIQHCILLLRSNIVNYYCQRLRLCSSLSCPWSMLLVSTFDNVMWSCFRWSCTIPPKCDDQWHAMWQYHTANFLRHWVCTFHNTNSIYFLQWVWWN